MTKIDLVAPVDFNGQTVTHIQIREPNGSEFIRFGEPYVLTASPGGGVVNVEEPGAIEAYCQAIIVAPAGFPLSALSMADAMRLKEALFDFFSSARRSGSKAGQTSSSAPSDGSTQEPSAAPV